MNAGNAAAFGFEPARVRRHALDRHSRHVVQFYREDRSLLDALSQYIGTALLNGDAAVIVATQAHNEALVRELSARGLDVERAIDRGRYMPFDASEVLSQIMVDGMPEESRFTSLMGKVIERAKSATKRASPCIAIFGEMVALLWADGKHGAAIRLEELWNDLA